MSAPKCEGNVNDPPTSVHGTTRPATSSDSQAHPDSAGSKASAATKPSSSGIDTTVLIGDWFSNEATKRQVTFASDGSYSYRSVTFSNVYGSEWSNVSVSRTEESMPLSSYQPAEKFAKHNYGRWHALTDEEWREFRRTAGLPKNRFTDVKSPRLVISCGPSHIRRRDIYSGMKENVRHCGAETFFLSRHGVELYSLTGSNVMYRKGAMPTEENDIPKQTPLTWYDSTDDL